MVARIADIFRPAEMAMVATVDSAAGDTAWGAANSPPAGYGILGRTVQDMHSGGRVTFLSLAADVAKGGGIAGASVAEPLPRPASPSNSAISSSSSGLLCPPVPQPYLGPPSIYLSDSEEGTLSSDSGGSELTTYAECDGGAEVTADAAGPAEASAAPQPTAFVPPAKPPLVALGAAFEAPAAVADGEAVTAVLAKYAAVPLPAVDAAALDAHISTLIEVTIWVS